MSQWKHLSLLKAGAHPWSDHLRDKKGKNYNEIINPKDSLSFQWAGKRLYYRTVYLAFAIPEAFTQTPLHIITLKNQNDLQCK